MRKGKGCFLYSVLNCIIRPNFSTRHIEQLTTKVFPFKCRTFYFGRSVICLKRGCMLFVHETNDVHLKIIDPRSIDQRRTETSNSASRIMHQSRPRYRQLHPPRISTYPDDGRLTTPPLPTHLSHSLWTTFRSLSPGDLPVTEEYKKKKTERGLKTEPSRRSRMLAKRHLSRAPDTARD